MKKLVIKMKNSKISVIIPVYNGEEFLEDCLNSVLNNTYKNIEIIVINDGSTDKTSEILKKYQNYNFKIIEQENSGVSQARNTGLKTATGDYIMFLDADDIINNDYLESLIKTLHKNKLDIIKSSYGNFKITTKNIELISYFKDNYYEIKHDDIDNIFINTTKLNSSCMQLIDINLIKNYQIYFSENIGFGEDFIFTYTLFKKAKRIGYLNNNGYLCRINNQSASRTGKIKKQIKNSIDCINAYQILVNKHNVYKVYKKILLHINYLIRNIEIKNITFETYKRELSILFNSVEWEKLKKVSINFKEIPFKNRLFFQLIYNEKYEKIWFFTKIYALLKK